LTDCGRCDAPIGWSGKTDCEFLTFAHETLKAEVMGLVGPASFTAWLTPGNYAGRLLPQQTAQPREAALVYKRSDRLLFMERPGVVDKDAWAAVEKVLTDVLGFARNPGRASEGREPPAAPPTGLVKPVSEADALSGVAAPPATQPEAFDLDYAAHPVDPRAKPSLPPRELTNRLRRVPDVLRPDSSVFIVGWFNDLAFFDDEVGAECKKVDREVRQLLADDTPAASPAPPATQPVETR
jgi:hypothetical protein